MGLAPLEHHVLRHSKEFDQKSFLLAISGGLDSMVLLEVMHRLQPILKLQLVVAHVHHGSSTNVSFRDKAQSHVVSMAKAKGLLWVTNLVGLQNEHLGTELSHNLNVLSQLSQLSQEKSSSDSFEPSSSSVASMGRLSFDTSSHPPVPSSSEAEMREWRYAHLESWAKLIKGGIVTAHHRDDLLETQILRLIRGVGYQGLQSMTKVGQSGSRHTHRSGLGDPPRFRHTHRSGLGDPPRFRPFLELSREDLEKYTEERGVLFLKDPSNENTDYMRNWLRQEWLPQLEKKYSGALTSLGRSLSHLAQAAQAPQLQDHCQSGQLDLQSLLPLTRSQKSSIMAQFMKAQGFKNYGQTHINEALKQFEVPPPHTFYLLRHKWYISHKVLRVSQLKGN